MTVADKIFIECTNAFHKGTTISCAQIKVRHYNNIYNNSQDKHIPSNITAQLKEGHSKLNFLHWLDELCVPYIEETENLGERPFIQSVTGVIWYKDGSWLAGFVDCTTWLHRWEYHSKPEIPEELL